MNMKAEEFDTFQKNKALQERLKKKEEKKSEDDGH